MKFIEPILKHPLLAPVRKRFSAMDDRTRLASRNILRMLVNNGLSLFLSVLYVPLFLSCMDNVRYGLWITVLGIVNWIGFLDIGFSQGLRNRLAETLARNDMKMARVYVSTAYAGISVIFIFIILLTLFCGPWIPWSRMVNTPAPLAGEVDNMFIIIIILMCVTFIIRTLNSVVLAVQQPAINSDIGLIGHLLCVGAVAVIAKTMNHPSLELFSLVMLLIPIFVMLAYSVYIFKWKYPALAPSFRFIQVRHVRDLLSLGIVFFIIQISCILLTQCNNIIIANLSSPEAVPEYSLANRYFSMLYMGFSIISTPFWSATTDAYARQDFQWIRKTVVNLEKFFLLFTVIGLLMSLAGPYIFPFWTRNRIAVRPSVLWLSYLYILLFMFSNIYITIINGIGAIRLQLYVTIALSLIHIAMAVLLGKLYGCVGVLVSQCIVYLFLTVWAFLQYSKIIQGTPRGSIWLR